MTEKPAFRYSHSGDRQQVIKPRKPTAKQLEKARQAVLSHLSKQEMIGTCPACKRCYAIPSVASHILEMGVCGECQQFFEGKREYVVVDRLPTIEEVEEQYENHKTLAPSEVYVLWQAYVEFRDNQGYGPEGAC